MADRRHIENRFLAISRRHIDRLMRNLDRKNRITYQYRTGDQNCNFRKFKMAAAAILKIALSPYNIAVNYPISIKFGTQIQISIPFDQKNRNFSNSRWRTDARMKIVFWLYLSAILADFCKYRNGDEESHADIGHVIKTAILENSRWRTVAILKIALSP